MNTYYHIVFTYIVILLLNHRVPSIIIFRLLLFVLFVPCINIVAVQFECCLLSGISICQSHYYDHFRFFVSFTYLYFTSNPFSLSTTLVGSCGEVYFCLDFVMYTLQSAGPNVVRLCRIVIKLPNR